MPPLSAAELVKHPEFEHVTWPLKPAEKGKAAVAEGRGGPVQISYEIHGNGPMKLVWIMGLAGFKTSWQRQTKDFGHGQNTNRDQSTKYSCLIFDNRGVGESDKPLMRYTTTEMAKDTLELIDHVGWNSQRQLHVIGVSLGGMIGQELALMAPERIASLILVSTAPKLFSTIGWFQNLRDRINMFIPKSIDIELDSIKARVFSQPWLSEPDAEGHFPTNGDRWAAQELAKRRDVEGFTKRGFILQAMAANWHHKSTAQLNQLGDEVGRDRILVIHGTVDRMITPPHGELLAKELGGEEKGVTKCMVEGRSHGLPMEWRRPLTKLIAEFVEKGGAL